MVNEYEPSFLGGYILEVKVKVYRTQFYLVKLLSLVSCREFKIRAS